MHYKFKEFHEKKKVKSHFGIKHARMLQLEEHRT